MAGVRRRLGRRSLALGIAVFSSIALVACSTGGSGGSATSKPDDGTTLTMWVRNTSGNVAQSVVDEYNRTHKNKVKLTIIPADSFQQKVGAAAGSGGLPDLLSSDVVYSPNYVKQGLLQDVTSRVKALSFYDQLSHAHTQAASANGKIYGTPFVVDSSLIIYNKNLFQKAGLDPSKGPATFSEIASDAKAIRDKVGGSTYGFYFGGNCSGCNAYTMFPYLAAAGTPPFTDDGKKAQFNTPAMQSVLDLYKRMWDDGDIAPSAKTEDGTNWATSFAAGKVGILPIGSFEFGALAKAKFQWGVAGLPAPDGSKTSTFIGGDVLAITHASKHVDQAWNFMEWSLEKDAQVNVLAKSGNLPSRVDFADNAYSSKDPRIVATIKGEATGYTPSSIGYGDAINNQNGPWLKMIRDYVFNDKSDAITTGQSSIQASLDQTQ